MSSPTKSGSTLVNLWRSIASFLAFLTLFNIVAHYDEAIALVASLVWLGSWWEYFSGLTFHWLPIELYPTEQNLIVLLLLSLSIAIRADLFATGSLRSAKDWKSAIGLLKEKFWRPLDWDGGKQFKRYVWTVGAAVYIYILVFLSRMLKYGFGPDSGQYFFNVSMVYMLAIMALLYWRKSIDIGGRPVWVQIPFWIFISAPFLIYGLTMLLAILTSWYLVDSRRKIVGVVLISLVIIYLTSFIQAEWGDALAPTISRLPSPPN